MAGPLNIDDGDLLVIQVVVAVEVAEFALAVNSMVALVLLVADIPSTFVSLAEAGTLDTVAGHIAHAQEGVLSHNDLQVVGMADNFQAFPDNLQYKTDLKFIIFVFYSHCCEGIMQYAQLKASCRKDDGSGLRANKEFGRKQSS